MNARWLILAVILEAIDAWCIEEAQKRLAAAKAELLAIRRGRAA